MTPGSERPAMPEHIEDTVRTVASLHARHDQKASFYQRVIQRAIDRLGTPGAAGFIGAVLTVWIGSNVVLTRLHLHAFDPPPFPLLQGLVTAAALFMTVLILASQQHENQIAEHRAQITLELTMVSEQKIAKLIQLVEHQRRDNPQMTDRTDPEADAMAKPADTHAIFEAVRETRNELTAKDERAGAPGGKPRP
jgi:uncharacterized membrane protein